MAEPPRRLPETGLADLLRFCLTLLGAALRHPLTFSARTSVRAWARAVGERRGSADFIIRLGPKRLLFVGSPKLLTGILNEVPREAGVSAGDPKRGGMSFLAPHALTTSHDEQWVRLRAFNEDVLEPGRPHDDEGAFLAAVRRGFDGPIATEHDIQDAMGRTMVGIVFGPSTPPASLAKDVEVLSDYVQSPIRRALLAPLGARRLARFRAQLRRAYESAVVPSLVARARQSTPALSAEERFDQVPHWMFTFVQSGTDLLVRSLALVCTHAEVRERALAELAANSPADDPARVHRLAFVNACVRETAYLYPSVTRSFHRARDGAAVAGVAIPAGVDVVHSFPPVGLGSRRRVFDPGRWLAAGGGPTDFDPFLVGPRRCPGRELITFVCVAALAELLERHDLVLAGSPLEPNALPEEFPRRGVRFERAGGGRSGS